MIDFFTKKYFLLDLDGTLYEGQKLFPFTLKFLQKLRTSGRQPVFLTNNSSKSTAAYFQKLKKLGIAESIDEIYTSARATIEYLHAKKIRKIFLLANPEIEREFTEAGFSLTQAKQFPQAVVLTFDTTFTYQKFCQAYDYIMAGVPFYATHPDLLLPRENKKFHPDIGTFISAFFTATEKKPMIIGKPEKHIYSQLRRRLGCQKNAMIMIGDRLYTDIKGAKDYGISSVLVLSGETTAISARKSKIKPDMILENLGMEISL